MNDINPVAMTGFPIQTYHETITMTSAHTSQLNPHAP